METELLMIVAAIAITGIAVPIAVVFMWRVIDNTLDDMSIERSRRADRYEIERTQQLQTIRAINRGDILIAQNATEESSKISAQTPIHYPGWRPDPERSAMKTPT